MYLYKLGDKPGLAEVNSVKNKETKKWETYLLIGKYRFNFTAPIISAPYNVPDGDIVQKYIKGKFTPRSFKDIANDVVNHISVLYDFKFETDLSIVKIFIGQSYLTPIINAFFFLAIDASKGAGKTTLLEIITYLSRHGYMAGDTSPAAIPRMIHELNLSLGVDELDQATREKGDSEIATILRKAQRKGNTYIRCEGKNHTPKSYDVAGGHNYTFRSEVEDAFKDRSINIHASTTSDSRLPVLNFYKQQVLKPIADELFLWSIDNMVSLWQKSENNRSKCSKVVGCSGTLKNQKTEIEQIRQDLYSQITNHLSKDDLKLLKELTGRNIELSFIALDVSKLLGIDILKEIKEVMTAKQESDIVSESYYLDALEDFLIKLYEKLSSNNEHIKKDGIHAGGCFYPKNLVYQEFIQYITGIGIMGIGTKKYNSLLRELGFIEGDNLLNIRVSKIPKMCIVFSEKVLKRLSIISSKPIEIEELLEPENHLCKTCGKTPCQFYAFGHYFCTELCAKQFQEATK